MRFAARHLAWLRDKAKIIARQSSGGDTTELLSSAIGRLARTPAQTDRQGGTVSLKALSNKIMHSVAVDHARSNKNRQLREMKYARDKELSCFSKSCESEGWQFVMKHCDPQYKDLLELISRGLTLKQIANLNAVPPSTVRSRWTKAKESAVASFNHE